jgi:hypothetical protein
LCCRSNLQLPKQLQKSNNLQTIQEFAIEPQWKLVEPVVFSLFSIAAPFSGLEHASIGAGMTCFGSHGRVNSRYVQKMFHIMLLGHLFSSWSKNVNDLFHFVALLGLMHLCLGSGIPLLIVTGCSDGKALAGENHHGVLQELIKNS